MEKRRQRRLEEAEKEEQQAEKKVADDTAPSSPVEGPASKKLKKERRRPPKKQPEGQGEEWRSERRFGPLAVLGLDLEWRAFPPPAAESQAASEQKPKVATRQQRPTALLQLSKLISSKLELPSLVRAIRSAAWYATAIAASVGLETPP